MIIQWSNEDQAFVVTLPEFEGCKTHGATYEKAVKMGRQAIESLMEAYAADGKPLPAPHRFENEEDYPPERDASFWEMIRERREKDKTIPWEDVKRELGLKTKSLKKSRKK
jgi:antitoxin HicB